MIPDAASTSEGLGINLVVQSVRKGGFGTGIRILFLYFHKLLQHDSEVHLQRLEEVCVDFILDHVFGLCAS